MILEPTQPIGITLTNVFYVVSAFHGCLLSIFLWVKRHGSSAEKNAHRLFAGLLGIFSLMLFEHALDLGGYFFQLPILIESISPLYLLIGPLLYGYVNFQTNPNLTKLSHRHWLHLIPCLLQVLIVLPFILSNNEPAKILFFYEDWYPLLVNDGNNLDIDCPSLLPWHWGDCIVAIEQAPHYPELDLILKTPLAVIWESNFPIFALWLSLVAYTSASIQRLRAHKRQLKNVTSSTHAKDLSWIWVFLILLACAICIYITVTFQALFFDNPWLSIDARNHLIYSLLALCVIYVGHQALHQPTIFSPDLKRSIDAGKVDSEGIKYRNSALTTDTSKEIALQIRHCLDEQEVFLDPQLTLAKLSDLVGINGHLCSQVINESMHCSFFDLVNGCRLRKAKELLITHEDRPILQIAMEAGFNSKTSFYNFFKKKEGLTPSAWRNQQLKTIGSVTR